MEEHVGKSRTNPKDSGGAGVRLAILLLAITAGVLAFFTHPDVVMQEPQAERPAPSQTR